MRGPDPLALPSDPPAPGCATQGLCAGTRARAMNHWSFWSFMLFQTSLAYAKATHGEVRMRLRFL